MEKKNIGAMGFSMGLVFGGGVWLVTSVMLETEFTEFLIQGQSLHTSFKKTKMIRRHKYLGQTLSSKILFG